MQLASQFNIPYCVLLDSDIGTNEEAQNRQKISGLQDNGIKAYLTRRREPENYIHLNCLQLPDGSMFSFNETDDTKVLIGREKRTRQSNVLDTYWVLMSADQIREVEK